MALNDFSSITRFRVAFCDIDMLQHVNNASCIVWAETVRCNDLDEVLGKFLCGTCGIILAKTEFEYLHPLDYREEVVVAAGFLVSDESRSISSTRSGA